MKKAAIFLADGHRKVKLSSKFTIYYSFQKLEPLILLLFFLRSNSQFDGM